MPSASLPARNRRKEAKKPAAKHRKKPPSPQSNVELSSPHVLSPDGVGCLAWACRPCKDAVKRRMATVRERRRVQVLNEAFSLLRTRCRCDPRQPKLDILQAAIRYIESLKGILTTQTLNDPPYVNEPFQPSIDKSNMSSCSDSSSSLDSLSAIVQRINPDTKYANDIWNQGGP